MPFTSTKNSIGIIRVSYRFTYQGQTYQAVGIDMGETINETIGVNELRCMAVCHALGIDAEEFVERFPGIPIFEPKKIQKRHWDRAGIVFEYCQLAE